MMMLPYYWRSAGRGIKLTIVALLFLTTSNILYVTILGPGLQPDVQQGRQIFSSSRKNGMLRKAGGGGVSAAIRRSSDDYVAPEEHRHRRKATSIQTLDEVHLQRLLRVEKVCTKRGLTNELNISKIAPQMFMNYLVDDKQKLVYCVVPKVGCTNWKRVLLVLTGKMNSSDPAKLPDTLVHGQYQREYLKPLSMYPPDQIIYRLKNYFKFAFTREPLERVLSAWRNKFLKQEKYNLYFFRTFGRKIIARYRKKPRFSSLMKGNDVTFKEFVEYLAETNKSQQLPMNIHWAPVDLVCMPCMIHYDVIGKFETLEADAEFTLRKAGVGDLVEYPSLKKHRYRTADLMEDAYRKLPQQLVARLLSVYAHDYETFGYDMPRFFGYS